MKQRQLNRTPRQVRMRKYQAKQNWLRKMKLLNEQRLAENTGKDDEDVEFQNHGRVQDTNDMMQDRCDTEGEDSECSELLKLALESMERNRATNKEGKKNTTTDVTMKDVSASTTDNRDQDTLSLFSETASFL